MHPSNPNDKSDDYHKPNGQDSMRINITVSKRLVKQADDMAKAEYTTRSDIVRQALMGYLRKPESLQKLAANITGRDVVLQCFLDDYQKRHPDPNKA